MPLYEYECAAENGRRFEIIQKFADAPLTVCPTCGGPVHRLISSPAIQFKGSGWYITDYAKKSGAEAGKKDGAKTDTKADSSASSSSPSSDTSSSSASAPAPASSAPAKKD